MSKNIQTRPIGGEDAKKPSSKAARKEKKLAKQKKKEAKGKAL